jgi:hypothetical protein
MMQTSTAAVRSAATGCGCGCGGMATHAGTAFVRPRFFAGQLLTEDDLQALTGYITGKDRLRNRLLSGSGVVCGLEVACDPCGNGKVSVRPGYALDCCGNDIVVGCPEQVDVNALVHDLRVRSLGVDCADPCARPSGTRDYGLYLRYVEEPADLIAPYATDESCPDTGCAPSRIRETFRFLVKCLEPGTGRFTPWQKLRACLGDLDTLGDVRARAGRLAAYQVPMRRAVLTAGVAVPFDAEARQRLAGSLDDLTRALADFGDQPSGEHVRTLTERVRARAGALARYDLAGSPPDVAGTARETLVAACDRLTDAFIDGAWGDPLYRALARAVVDQARMVAGKAGPAPLELRMLAQGTPLSYALRRDLIADLGRLRQWLLVRLESAGQLTDCSVRPGVAGVTLPPPLPEQPAGDRLQVGAGELNLMAVAAQTLASAVVQYVAGCVCASLLPPCGDCADSDVLLARLEVDDCEVLRICAAERDQLLPGGPGYSAWLPVLYQARALAERVCCQPAPDQAGHPAGTDLSYVDIHLPAPAGPTELDELLHLLSPSGAGTGTGPAGLVSGAGTPRARASVAVAPPAPPPAAPPAASPPGEEPAVPSVMWQELADLRERIGGLTATVQALREHAGEPREAPRPAEELPEEPDAANAEATGGGSAGEAAPAAAEPAKAEPAKAGPAKAAPAKRTARPQRPGSQER